MNLLGRVLLLLVVVAPAGLVGQEPVAVRRAIPADASIKIWTGGGSVRVEGWDRESLVVTGQVEPVAGGRFFFRAEGDAAKLGVEGDQAAVRGTLTVRVPARATIWIRTGSAAVTVRELDGAVDVSTVSGDIDARGRPATLYAESMAGDLDLHIKAGIARARAGTGRITFTGSVEDLALRSVGGALEIEAPGLRRGRFVTVDGAIEFTGAVRAAGALVFETHSGDVTLALPAGLAADFRVSTFHGAVEVGYPGVEAPEPNGRRLLTFETGDGGAEVEITTYSGTVRVLPR